MEKWSPRNMTGKIRCLRSSTVKNFGPHIYSSASWTFYFSFGSVDLLARYFFEVIRRPALSLNGAHLCSPSLFFYNL